MRTVFRKAIFASLLTCLGGGSSAWADAFNFTANFNSLASGANNTSIKSNLDALLAGHGTVAVSAGAVTERTYDGDGHTVGPCIKLGSVVPCSTGGSTPAALTLGYSDAGVYNNGAVDTFVKNDPSYTSFSFTFSGIQIDSVVFDWEVFPDGTPNQPPDLTFSTDLSAQVFHVFGQVPSGAYTHSPNSGRSSAEASAQAIGTYTSASLGGATVLTFADWPATIGIDNLTVNYHTPTSTGGGGAGVPEPSSIFLLGSVIAGLYGLQRKRKAA